MKIKAILMLIGGVAAVGCQPHSTGSQAGEGPPVATVNGTPISREFYNFYIRGVTGGKSASDLTPAQRDQALDGLIRAELVAQQAEKDGVTHEKDTLNMIELQRLRVLQDAVSERYLKERMPSEQELRAEYETQVAALPHLEYHARHILVATEPFAEKIIQQLDKGADFAELARKESMDASKENGGDLGWFSPDRMDKAFVTAVAGLKPGEYTHAPVQTQYGWHIIKLEETRSLAPPSYESVKQRLQQFVMAKKFRAYQDQLMKDAKIQKSS